MYANRYVLDRLHLDEGQLNGLYSCLYRVGRLIENVAASSMVVRAELNGVLVVGNRIGPQGFTDLDLILLQIFADQAAVMLQTQQLIESKRESDRLATFGLAVADIAHTIKNRVF